MKLEGNESRTEALALRRMTVFVVLMLPLVIGLGVWQLQRAAYKQSLMDAYFDKLGGLPVGLSGEPVPEPFTRVRLRGHYESDNLLLDNQVNNARQGFWVYTPFTTHAATWLINRGWQEAPPRRGELPRIPDAPEDEVDVVALIWPDTGMLPLFGQEGAKVVERLDSHTLRIQRLDFNALHGELAAGVIQVELRLEDAQPGVLQAAPQTMGFGVERHQGYAFQWFGLAVALVAGNFFYRRSFSQPKT